MITVKMKNQKSAPFEQKLRSGCQKAAQVGYANLIKLCFFKKKNNPKFGISVFCCSIFIWFIKTKLKKPKVNKNMLFLSLNVLNVYQINIFQFVQFMHKIKNKNIPLIFLKLFGAPCRAYPTICR